RPPAVRDPRPVARGAGARCRRANLGLDGAVVEEHLRPAVHLRGPGGVRLLRDVVRSGAALAPTGARPPTSLPRVGLPGDAPDLHRVFPVARGEHRAREAARRRRRRRADSRRAAGVLLAGVLDEGYEPGSRFLSCSSASATALRVSAYLSPS